MTPDPREARASPETMLFVYGTFLAGESNHARLAGARFVSAAVTRPAYELADLGPHPALASGGSTAVHGELWAVGPALLAELDAFEGHPDWYRRARVALDGGAAAEAYQMRPEQIAGLPRIPGGSWRSRHG